MHIVCCAAQENWAHANGFSTLTGTTKSWFSRICSSMMSFLNGIKCTMEVPSTQGKPCSKFKENSDIRAINSQKILCFFFFLFFSHTMQKSIYVAYAYFNLAEICYTYWGSNIKCNYRFSHKSSQCSSSF